MKLFKKLAVVAMAITLCFGAGATLASCGGNGGSSTSSEATVASGYKFKVVKADGSAAVSYMVLLCQGDACGVPQMTDANGVATVASNFLPGDKSAAEYDIHVMAPGSSDYLEHEGLEKTPAEFSNDEIVLTLK